MKDIFRTIGFASLVMAMAGCTSDAISIDDIRYEESVKNFIGTFGVPDPDHNYAMAKSAGLHITTKVGGHVAVTAEVQGTEYLFADLDVTPGTHALPVTIPASVKKLTVISDRGIQTVATDATVDLDKAPARSRISAKDTDFPVLYGGEYNIIDEGKESDMQMECVQEDAPYLYLPIPLTGSSPNRNLIKDKILKKAGASTDFTDYTIKENMLIEEKSGLDPEEKYKRFNPSHPARHETVLTSQGSASYYIFPIWWRSKNGKKDFQIVLHKACEGTNDLKSPYIISFADEDEDISKNPFPHLGYSTVSINPYYVYPFDDHVKNKDKETTYLDEWEKLKFGEDRTEAFPITAMQALVSRGIKINLNSGGHYEPGVAIAVRSNFTDGVPGSFVSSSPFYNTHPDAWGQNYYDVPLHNLYLASAATLRWDLGPQDDGTTDELTPYIIDKLVDVNVIKNSSYPPQLSSDQWAEYRNELPILLGFSSQPTKAASKDMRDYCDVILLITPHNNIITGAAGLTGAYYRHLFAHLPKPMQWTLAAEDLGGSEDWDFNDVVFTFTDVIRNLKSANWLSSQAMISGPSGAGSVRTLKIKPVATGGTMPIYITLTAKGVLSPGDIPAMPSDGETMFSDANKDIKEALDLKTGDNEHTYIIGTEVHKWLGAGSYKQFVNVGSTRSDVQAREVEIIIPTDLDLADEVRIGQGGGSKEDSPLYGFAVLVDKENTLQYDAFANGGPGYIEAEGLEIGDEPYLIGAPDDDKEVKVPQMILVQGDWEWPSERTNILDAYPNFKEWVADHTNSLWIMNPELEKVTKKKTTE